jgi:hypothetical protein
LCRFGELVNAKKRDFPVSGAPAALPALRWIAENLTAIGWLQSLASIDENQGDYTQNPGQ